uniref:DUF4283 domain-containing protein n=1 Tax=Lactuca sativa TaxID=4236 RepID=A0A9R1XMN9_LACSA|nr:hypothetical protein LSAT_V11C300138180 [Lactuca sativa]
MVGLRFQSPSDVDDFLANKTYWGMWFKDFKAGTDVSGVFDRLAWLRIVGLPVKLWDEEKFSRIASEFGKVVVPAEILPSMKDLSLSSICILTDHKKRINEEVLVELNKSILKVGVFESDFGWSPFPFYPVDCIDSNTNRMDNCNDVSMGNDDLNILEEGKINVESDDDEEGVSETILENGVEKSNDIIGEAEAPMTVELHSPNRSGGRLGEDQHR